jgi:hypothetical protein
LALTTHQQKTEFQTKAREVYEKIGQYALSKQVTIHVLKIQDPSFNEECDVTSIQNMCSLTGGKMGYTDSKNLKESISKMFSSDNIANDVEVKIILSSPFKFSTENEKDITIIEGGATSIVKKLGNITAAYNEFKIEVESLSDTKLLEMVDLALYENELFPY